MKYTFNYMPKGDPFYYGIFNSHISPEEFGNKIKELDCHKRALKYLREQGVSVRAWKKVRGSNSSPEFSLDFALTYKEESEEKVRASSDSPSPYLDYSQGKDIPTLAYPYAQCSEDELDFIYQHNPHGAFNERLRRREKLEGDNS